MSPDSIRLEDINLLDRDVFARSVPHDWFAHLRDTAPVYRHPERDGSGFWVLTRHADVATLTRDWARFSSDQDLGGVVGLDPPAPSSAQDALVGGKMMLTIDPPDHTRYRKLVNRAFTPKAIRALEERLRLATSRILDHVSTAADGRCDFVVDIAAELPLIAIAEFLGVPTEDRHKLFDWSNRLIGSDDPEYSVDAAKLDEARVEMFLYANELARQRRAAPTGDLVSDLIHGEVDGEVLSELDFNLFFMLLAVAGNETTRNAMSHGMAALLDSPDELQRLLDEPAIMGTTGCEEILRWASPVMYFRRNATEDMVFGEHQIAAGDKVSIWFISANRDEDVFDEPFRFDLGRDPNPQVAFGGGGPHHCLGAHLARLEIRVLFEELAQRVQRVEKLGEPDRLRSNFINGIKHLPVRLVV